MSSEQESLEDSLDEPNTTTTSLGKKGVVKRFVSVVFKRKSGKFNAPQGGGGGSSSSNRSSMIMGGEPPPGEFALKRDHSMRSSLMQLDPMTIGIPEDEELDAIFTKIMRDTIGEEKLGEIKSRTSRENKWRMICNSGRVTEIYQGRYTPEYFLEKFQDIFPSPSPTKSANFIIPSYLNKELVSSLRIQLTNQPVSYIKH